MIRKLLVSAAVGTFALGLATPAFAVGPTAPGNECQRAGMAYVKNELPKGTFAAIAKSGVDAGTLKALGVRGISALDDDTMFTLPQVLELHRTTPGLFPWCD